jgi:hypothetical protein
MKRFLLITLALIAGAISYSQIFIAGQDFDTEISWSFTEDPASYMIDNKDIWAATDSLYGNNELDTPVAGTKFWGMRDLDNPHIEDPVDSGGLGLVNPYDHTLNFGNIFLSGATEVSVSFYYNAFSLNNGYLKVEFFFDNVSQGVENVFTDSDGTATIGWEKFIKYVPDGTDSISMTIIAYNDQDYLAVDDIRILAGTVIPDCKLVIGNTSAACDSTTDDTDTWTATINFSGGATETFSISASSGEVGGDDPGSVTEGSITVTGISEGTDLTVNITSEACDEEIPISSPSCSPPEGLPFEDVFDYDVGSELATNGLWTSENDGDEILVSAGNLSYPDLKESAGNSVSFSGDGKECVIHFTTVNSGVVYSSFIFRVLDMTGFTKGGYFAVLGDYNARLYIKPFASQFVVGIGQTNKIDETKFATDMFDMNQDIFLVMSYDLTTRFADVWINPAGADFEAETPPTSDLTMPNGTALEIGQFILRQDSPEETPVLVVDEIRIGLTWAAVTPRSLSYSIAPDYIDYVIFPNPVTDGYLKIRPDDPGEKSIKIFDVLGRKVYSNERFTDGIINVYDLHPGIYFIQIDKANKTSTQKFVIK